MKHRFQKLRVIALCSALAPAARAQNLEFNPDTSQWFPWTATADVSKPSVIDASGLLQAPAGKGGRVTRSGDRLTVGGKPIKFWGVNTCYSAIMDSKDISQQRAAFYAKYGINAVRLHKFADGPDWDGALDPNSYVLYNPEKLARMDTYVAQLKARGIYVLLSANFGRPRVYRNDAARVPFINEFGQPDGRGIIDPGGGAMFLSNELQDIQIDQLVNLLKHRNADTGLTYAADPCVMCVELINEDSALFYGVMGAMDKSPTLKARMGKEFAAWLKAKYKTEDGLTRAWGNVLNTFGHERMTGEAYNNGEGPVYPVGNPWFYDPDQMDGKGMMAPRKRRLVDTMLFWYDRQNDFYSRFTAAIRKAGYTGEILSSNWQAGRGPSHYLNLHSDWLVGMIDRHNYQGGPASMLAVPGSGMLSTGMQQVKDRPFMISEWIHTFPSEFLAEGPALIGAYGMGLNGWDASFMFQNGDRGRFRNELGETWDIVAPNIIGLFPAVSRQVIRGDVKESPTVFSRNVDLPSLKKGELNFDDRVTHAADVKNFAADTTPVQALAVGRVVVDFVQAAKKTETVNFAPFDQNGALFSATRELAWRPGADSRDGRVAINTPATQAVVGFAQGKTVDLKDVSITLENPYAVVYVTSLDNAPIATSKRLLVTTLARARNTGMSLQHDGKIGAKGGGPILMEPVVCSLAFKRAAAPVVNILDHDGCRTGGTLSPANGKLRLDGRETKAVYYEVVYK